MACGYCQSDSQQTREWCTHASMCENPDKDSLLVRLHLNHAELVVNRPDHCDLVEVQRALPVFEASVDHASQEEILKMVLVV